MTTLQVLDNGLHIENGTLQFLWFRLFDGQGPYYRCVALTELVSIPVALREDYDLLAKQWAAVRGLYNAGVDFVYSAAGIYSPDHVGVVQFYGSAAEHIHQGEAARQAIQKLAAVKATLANYPQSRLAPPNLQWMEWYIDFLTHRSRNMVALLGHPDPRQTRRGVGGDVALPNDTADDLAAEQNEILFRGLAKLREDFIFQVTAAHVGRKHLTDGLIRVAQLASNVASRRKGSISLGFSLSLPIVAALSNALNGGYSATDSQSHSVSDGHSHSWGQSHTDSYAHTQSQSTTVTESEQHGIAITHTDSEGYADSQTETESTGVTESKAHTDSYSFSESDSVTNSHSVAHSSSVAHGTTTSQGGSSSWSASESSNWQAGSSTNQGSSVGVSESESQSQSQSQGVSQGESQGQSSSSTESDNWAEGANWNVNANVNAGVNGSVGVPGVASVGASGGASVGGGYGENSSVGGGTSESTGVNTGQSTTVSQGSAVTNGETSGVTMTNSQGAGTSQGVGGGSSQTVGGSSFSSTSQSTTATHGTTVTDGVATSHGETETWGQADTEGLTLSKGQAASVGFTKSIGSADSITESHQWGKSVGYSTGTADTWGKADGKSEEWGQSHTEADMLGVALGRSGMKSISGGFSTGLVPGFSIGRSWQTEDDVAERLTEVIRQLEGLLNQASAEGGFMTDAVLFTAGEAGEIAASSLVPQAFHGPNVPTPVLTVRPDWQDAVFMRQHALAFLHYPGADEHDPLGGFLWTKYATLLTAGQLAAYTAPGLFEEGTASTVMAPIPKEMGFYPVMPGDVVLGHQYSPETADLTSAPVRLDEGRLMHTMFAGDTGWGKSVAAIRMAYETTLRWKTRTVVLDFGAGWRQLLNAPGLEGHVDILQLWPDAARPLRWNPLQIGRHINPETQWRAFADIFGSIAKLGVKRQKQEMLEALRRVYLKAGVLIDDPEVRSDPEWGRIQAEEAALIRVSTGTTLGNLTRMQRQQVAVIRSSKVGLADLYREIQQKLRAIPPRDTMLTGVLEGILFRMNALVQGSAAAQFAAGADTVPMEDLAKPWGITIIEGGMFLDDFGKAFLLGWAGWHLYTDMVARRVHEVHEDEPLLQIFFEEANKIFGGVDDGGDDESGGISAAQRFGDMFRDARKYRARLHVITQAPSLIPPDIISSCNNLVSGFLKNPKDKDLVLSALARSEKGFHDEPWRRFLDDLPIGMALGRFPYTAHREDQRPFLFRPYLLDVPEPSDREIEHKLGSIHL